MPRRRNLFGRKVYRTRPGNDDWWYDPASIYLFKFNRSTKKKVWVIIKVNKKDTRTISVFIVHFEHNFSPFSSVSILLFQNVNVWWDMFFSVFLHQNFETWKYPDLCLSPYDYRYDSSFHYCSIYVETILFICFDISYWYIFYISVVLYIYTVIVCFHKHSLQSGTNAFLTEVTNSIMEGIITNDLAKKEPNRSLGILCQKFIMLFMVSKVWSFLS